MSDAPSAKQLAFLKRLKYDGPSPKTKQDASAMIDQLLAAKADKRQAEKLSTPAKQDAFLQRQSKQQSRQRDKDHKAWLRERRQEIRQQTREDMRDQRRLERDLSKHGGMDRGHALAGWILRIGAHCEDAKHLNGLLVRAEDALADPGLLPPYDSCRKETCECEIDPVNAADVPRGTRIAERASPSA